MDEMLNKLVEGAIGGNSKALEALIQLKSRDILYLSLRFTNKSDYEDAAQEAFYNITKDISTVRKPEYFDTWMYSTIRNACRSYLKKKSKFEHEILSSQEDDHFMNAIEENTEFLPVEFAEEAELRNVLMEALDELPENYKETIILRHLEVMSYQEIAEALNISLKAVNNNLSRGRMKLKAILENRTGRVLKVNSLAVGALPILTRALRVDRVETIRPEVVASFLAKAQVGIVSSKVTIGSKLVRKMAKKVVSNTAKSLINGIGIAGAVGVGLGSLYFTQVKKPTKLDVPAIVMTERTDVPTSIESTEEKLIVTIADMIGEDAAEQLQGFGKGVSDDSWQDFLNEIGAEYEGSANVQGDYEYTMYVLEKQEKQLLLFAKKALAGSLLSVKYEFGSIKELPLMIEVIRIF